MRSEFLRIAAAKNGAKLVDVHDIHCPVADIAEHIGSRKCPQVCRNGGEALRVNIRAHKLHMIVRVPEGKFNAFIVEKVRPEAVLLLTNPGKRQTNGQVDPGRGQSAQFQLPGNGRQRQDVIVLVHHFIGGQCLTNRERTFLEEYEQALREQGRNAAIPRENKTKPRKKKAALEEAKSS